MSRSHISSNIMSRMRAFESTDSSAESPKRTAGPSDRWDGNSNVATAVAAAEIDEANRITDSEQQIQNGRTVTKMMMSSPPPGVQTDAEGLILPKKLINPCLESTDRKQLHRELKFNTKIGKSVLNQKSELQRAYEKQRERQQHQQQDLSPTAGLKGELSRVIMERAQKHEHSRQHNDEEDEDKQYVNPEYLNIRAKLRPGQRDELK